MPGRNPASSPPFTVGAPLRVGGQNVTTQVFETGRAARSHDLGAEVLGSHALDLFSMLSYIHRRLDEAP